MLHNNYPKGSEWKKWDLHVHTPNSVLNSEFGDDWDKYVKTLFQQAIAKNIAAIGITDYYFITGYKKLKQDYLDNDAKLAELFSPEEIEKIKQILVIPNIEFRIDKTVIGDGEKNLKWERKVNFHLLFSDQVPIAKIEEFLSKIKIETIATEGSAQTIYLTESNLNEIGEKLQEHQPEFKTSSSLFVGMVNAWVDTNQLRGLLDQNHAVFKGQYFFALPADEDLSEVSWTSQGHLLRKNLLIKSDFIFSSNENTAKFGLGAKHKTETDFLKEFERLKPCIWGCDAHSFERLFEPEKRRYTWIKSAPTFEGLRQVLHEPADRVKIQPVIPEEKTPYLVIDRVRFVDNSNKALFQPELIELNENLNVIIGGKSSGKSLLLHHLAMAVDKNQVIEKTGNGSDYDEISGNIDFEVFWKGGDVDRLNDDDKKGHITYIPQLFINHLAEEGGKDQLNELINKILLQNDGYKTFFDETVGRRDSYLAIIGERIRAILSLRQSYQDKVQEIKLIGTKEQIAGEILRLEGEILNLRKESGFTSIEEQEFQKLDQLIASDSNKINNLETLSRNLVRYGEKIKLIRSNTLASIDTEYKNLSELPESNAIEPMKVQLEAAIKTSFETFTTAAAQAIQTIATERQGLDKTLAENVLKLKPYETKVTNQTLLEKQQNELNAQKGKQNLLSTKIADQVSIRDQGERLTQDLFDAYTGLYSVYKERLETLQKLEYVNIGIGLKLESQLRFDGVRFYRLFTNLFDLRTPIRNHFNERFTEENYFIFSPEQHVGNIRDVYNILRKPLDETGLTLKSGTNIEDLLTRLLDDYFKIDYSIEHKGDNILKMSPGKRGVVLLQLILHISNAQHPILIDQPEDNLDNRTIYQELRQFVKDRKKLRQIIIVTHNANLVVSTDAENVIVANQSGQQQGRDKRQYQFEYISGPLENTFKDTNAEGVLYQMGIREHVCEILEGGREAFLKREEKYGFKV